MKRWSGGKLSACSGYARGAPGQARRHFAPCPAQPPAQLSTAARPALPSRDGSAGADRGLSAAAARQLRRVPAGWSRMAPGVAGGLAAPRSSAESFRYRREGARRDGPGSPRAASPAESAAPSRGSYLPAPSRLCAGPSSPGGPRRRLRGGGDQRRSMAAAAPREGAVARGYGSAGPRPPAAMPGAPARGALSLRRPSPEPPRSVPSRAGRGGGRRGRAAARSGGGLPVERAERGSPARSPTEAAAGG